MADSPIQVPYHKVPISDADRQAVDRVLGSGWVTTGQEADYFEQEFKAYVGANVAVAVSSCTAALHLALALLNLTPEDEVIVPTMTFTATAAAALLAGVRPVIADVDPVSLNLTPETAQPVQTRHTKALLPVHYGGNPSGLRDLVDYAHQYRLHLVDDAAHALPAQNRALMIGGSHPDMTDATCFSFYATKTLTTGEGGMLTLRDPALAARARRLTLHGIDADAYQRSRQAVYHYEVVEHGFKYNLPDVLAALGRVQLARQSALAQARHATATFYSGLLPELAADCLTVPTVAEGYGSAWHLYPIRFNLEAFASGWTRDRLGARLRELGIGASMHYRPLHRHQFWVSYLGLDARRFPHADKAYDEVLSLPIWPGMTAQEQAAVVDTVAAVCREAKR